MGFPKYIRAIAIVVLLSLVSSPLAAQPCTGTRDHFLQPGDVNAGIVYGPIVPPTEAWLVTAAGLYTPFNYPTGIEFMMELIEPVPEQTGHADSSEPSLCCWRIPLLKQTGVQATPLAALGRSILMLPGQRLAGRTNAATGQFGIIAVFRRYPASCADTLATGMR